MPNNSRAVALAVLEKVSKQNSYSNLALDAALRQAHLDQRDANLATTIVYGVIQHKLTLEYILKPFVAGKKLASWVMPLLETAVFQLRYLDKVPARAVFYETTELAKARGNAGVAKLVTAVMHHVQRAGEPDFGQIADPLARLSIASSTPRWLVAKLTDQLGPERTASILHSINQPAAASLRVNTTKTTPAALQAALADRVPELALSEISAVGLVAPGGHLAGLPEFAAGDFTLQDESSQLVAPSLALQPGDHVLDACAAPGGKTTHIAQYLDPAQGGQVTALDLHPHKVKLIAQNAARLGLADRVSARAMDARAVAEQFAPESFDAVLVDAPCSGLGLMRRKPEIRYEKQPADLTHLHDIQLAILAGVAPVVKIGGRLTYSTCTMVREENQDVVAAFLAAHPGFKQVAVATDKPLAAHSAPALQLFPDDYGTDGFFIASFVREA